MAGRPCLARHPEPVLSGCRICGLYLTEPKYRDLWDGTYTDTIEEGGNGIRGRCQFRGMETGERRACRSCAARGVEAEVYQCSKHGLCTIERYVAGAECCKSCPDWVPAESLAATLQRRRAAKSSSRAQAAPVHVEPPPSFVARIDHHSHWPTMPGLRFNSSLIRWEDGYLFAYRHGWRGSNIFLGRLDSAYRAIGQPWKLDLYHAQQANYGREDVRLFWFRGRLHVSYVGVMGHHHGIATSVLYARLSSDLKVEQVYYPHYARRTAWEKNWGFFEHDGELYAVYTITNHRILHIQSEEASLAYWSSSAVPWGPKTEMRGGASPILVGNEYWHFFHSRYEPRGRKRQYMTGVYAFEARPPFRITRILPEPILIADPRTNAGRDVNYADVVFIGGSEPVHSEFGRVDHWLLCHGVHDRHSEVHRWTHAELEARMVRVLPEDPAPVEAMACPEHVACYI